MKKGNTWHFGYKAHVGTDKDTGLIHTVEASAANIHDVAMTAKLLTGDEKSVYGDSGYGKVIRSRQSGAHICSHQGRVPIPKNTAPGTAEADRQIEYAVRPGELNFG